MGGLHGYDIWFRLCGVTTYNDSFSYGGLCSLHHMMVGTRSDLDNLIECMVMPFIKDNDVF